MAGKWAADLKRDPATVRLELEQLLKQNVSAPFNGLTGEPFVNVLELNLQICKRYGQPS